MAVADKIQSFKEYRKQEWNGDQVQKLRRSECPKLEEVRRSLYYQQVGDCCSVL
jgi:hypothetical protein